MERDALLAYGASNLIHERLYYSSDAYEVCFVISYFLLYDSGFDLDSLLRLTFVARVDCRATRDTVAIVAPRKKWRASKYLMHVNFYCKSCLV